MPPTPRQTLNLAPPTDTSTRPSVIDAGPVTALLDTMTTDLALLKRLSPNSDACAALADVRIRLEQAIRQGGSGALWLSVGEYAAHEGVTTSAITYRIRKGLVASEKVGGRYLVKASERRAA